MIHVMLPDQLPPPRRRARVSRTSGSWLPSSRPCSTIAAAPSIGAARGLGAPSDRRGVNQASAYVSSTDRSWPFSFENICEALGVDADGLRQALKSELRS